MRAADDLFRDLFIEGPAHGGLVSATLIARRGFCHQNVTLFISEAKAETLREMVRKRALEGEPVRRTEVELFIAKLTDAAAPTLRE